MWLSYHPRIVGKPQETERNGKTLYVCDNSVVNLGYGWVNYCCDDYKEAYDLVCGLGHATSAQLKGDHRCEENFLSRQLLMVDVDSGMSIDELLCNDLYTTYGFGYYTTARHSEQQHRFRIMFVTEYEQNDAAAVRAITSGLLKMYSAGDTSCRDATRIYYGVPNCPRSEYRGVMLPVDVCDELAALGLHEEPIPEAKPQYRDAHWDDIAVDALLSRICSRVGNLRGDYTVWRAIAWATASVVGIGSAEYLMNKHWPEKTRKERSTLRRYRSNRDGPSIGTLISLSGISSLDRRLLELQSERRKLCLKNK